MPHGDDGKDHGEEENSGKFHDDGEVEGVAGSWVDGITDRDDLCDFVN